MTEKLDTSTGGFLILILPIAFLIIFLVSTWPVLLAPVERYLEWLATLSMATVEPSKPHLP